MPKLNTKYTTNKVKRNFAYHIYFITFVIVSSIFKKLKYQVTIFEKLIFLKKKLDVRLASAV